MPTEKLVELANLLDETARMMRDEAAVISEHVDAEIARGHVRIAEQIERTAERIRGGEYDE